MFNKTMFIVIKLNRKLGITAIIVVLLVTSWFLLPLLDPVLSTIEATTVVIDPGHGGIDGGSSFGDLLEKDINLAVSLKLENILKNANISTVMTRDEDISLESKSDIQSSRYRKDLHARKQIINKNAALFVSIHVNAHKSSNARGIYVFHYPNAGASQQLAEEVRMSINALVIDQYLDTDEIKVKRGEADYYVLRESKVPGVIIEIGFITNSEDRELIQEEAYQNQMAVAIAQGIINYIAKNN